MSLKIELAHQIFPMDIPNCSRCIPVIRLDELRRWLEANDEECNLSGGVYGPLLKELKEAQP